MDITKKPRIRTIVIAFTVGSILFTLIVAGIAINLILNDLYGENAQAELQNAYKLASNKIMRIETALASYSLHIAENGEVIATTYLVDHYQDKNNYQPLIFDNDKKKVAHELLRHITLTSSGLAVVYGANGEIIAFALHDGKRKLAGISNYKKGRLLYRLQNDFADQWEYKPLPSGLRAIFNLSEKYKNPTTIFNKNIYRVHDGRLIIENNRPIVRSLPDGRAKVLGYVRVFAVLDEEFFQQISAKQAISVSLVYAHDHSATRPDQLPGFAQLRADSGEFGASSIPAMGLIRHKTHFIQSYRIPLVDGEAYLVVSQPKAALTAAHNRTRISLVIVFFITAILTIFISVYLLNKMIVKPINDLVDIARINKGDDYPTFPVNASSNEIGRLGTVLNRMVDTIRERGSELGQSERLLKNTQKLARLGSWSLDHVSNELLWSDETYNILGLEPAAFAPSYELFLERVHPDDKDYVDRSFSESIANHTPYDIRHRLLLADGSIKHVREYCETEYADHGRPMVSSGSIQDITEQAGKDEQLRRTQKMDALDQLTGGIAHDFNNVLSVIMGFAELLKLEFSQQSHAAGYLDDIYQAAERARKLTAKLLAFTRKDVSSACAVDINQLLLEEQNMLQKTLTVRIRLHLDLTDQPWQVWLDRDELEDAILNMSINAMHAMPDGGELVLATQNATLNTIQAQTLGIVAGDYLLLSLTDTGKGMDNETLQRIFEPFFSTKKQKGTGLGMSQVYGFVQRSKGTINVYSDLNHGTRICIYFPRYQESVTIQAERRKIPQADDLAGHATVLVVDDEAALRRLTSEILSSKGYQVLCAEDAKQALTLLETESVDLLLSDVIMPGMSGYELAAEAQRLYPDIKIQMASGFSEEDPNRDNDQLYLQRLQKPFSTKVLLKKIKKILQDDTRTVDSEIV